MPFTRGACKADAIRVMATKPTRNTDHESLDPIPFARYAATARKVEQAERIFQEFDHVSRRMDDLARELHCFGYFDNDDRPRAA